LAPVLFREDRRSAGLSSDPRATVRWDMVCDAEIVIGRILTCSTHRSLRATSLPTGDDARDGRLAARVAGATPRVAGTADNLPQSLAELTDRHTNVYSVAALRSVVARDRGTGHRRR
jgi:hypothetical protein